MTSFAPWMIGRTPREIILAFLRAHADQWFNVKTIAEETGVNIGTARYNLNQMTREAEARVYQRSPPKGTSKAQRIARHWYCARKYERSAEKSWREQWLGIKAVRDQSTEHRTVWTDFLDELDPAAP